MEKMPEYIQKTEYKTLEEYIKLMPDNRRIPCEQIITDYYARLSLAPGSKNKHQNWPGGWWDHTTELMNLAQEDYNSAMAHRPYPFTFEEVIFPLFIHDLEKPWKYATNDELESLNESIHQRGYEKSLAFPKNEPHAFIIGLLEAYNVQLTPNEHNALEYAHGEIARYSANHRYMKPLATLVHICDIKSARIWFDYPLKNSAQDVWGAKRIQQ